MTSMKEDEPPRKIIIHFALCAAQIIFGISAVIGTIGLPSFHPLTFALARESSATILLLSVAHLYSLKAGRVGGILSGSMIDVKMILICGVALFASQAFYIIGIKLSSAVDASVWQPAQPIITVAICMLIGWEPFNIIRVSGILIAFIGCIVMVVGGGGAGGEAIGGAVDGDINPLVSKFAGKISFFFNCCGASLYVLASKKVLATGRYESIAVTAWSYSTASLIMAIFAVVLSWSKTITNFLCSDCDPNNLWHVPKSALPAVVWFVIMTSSVSYGLITWANKYATGTLVIGYTVMQPVASAVLIQLLIFFKLYASCNVDPESKETIIDVSEGKTSTVCLEQPDFYTAIGAIGVFAGLFFLIMTEPDGKKTKEKIDDNLPLSMTKDHMKYLSSEEELLGLLPPSIELSEAK